MLIICPSCGKWMYVDILPDKCSECGAPFIKRFPIGDDKKYPMGILTLLFLVGLYAPFNIVLYFIIRDINHMPEGEYVIWIQHVVWLLVLNFFYTRKKCSDYVDRIYSYDCNWIEMVRPVSESLGMLFITLISTQVFVIVARAYISIAYSSYPKWFIWYPYFMNLHYFLFGIVNLFFQHRTQYDKAFCIFFRFSTARRFDKEDEKRVGNNLFLALTIYVLIWIMIKLFFM